MASSLILVVEDDPDVLTLIEEMLIAEGFRVSTAEDGLEALAAARRERPDLIVLDLMMPRMNALQFRASKRRDADLRDIPLVCLTGASEAGTLAFELGTEDCLPKPFDPDVLLRVVRKHCPESLE